MSLAHPLKPYKFLPCGTQLSAEALCIAKVSICIPVQRVAFHLPILQAFAFGVTQALSLRASNAVLSVLLTLTVVETFGRTTATVQQFEAVSQQVTVVAHGCTA